MTNPQIEKSSRFSLASVGLGPKLIGVGVALFVLTRIINWLPLGLIDGPINAVLLLGALVSVLAGAGLIYLKSKRD